MEFMADACPVAQLSGKDGARWQDAHNTLLTGVGVCSIERSGSDIVAVGDGWRAMVERERAAQTHGFCLGLDAANITEAKSAGNAVCPPVARWIAQKLRATYA